MEPYLHDGTTDLLLNLRTYSARSQKAPSHVYIDVALAVPRNISAYLARIHIIRKGYTCTRRWMTPYFPATKYLPLTPAAKLWILQHKSW